MAPGGRRLRGWVPNQHGAWAMVLAPTIVGTLVAGPSGWHVLLLLAWVAAYCTYFSATRWLRSARRRRYRTPVVGHAAATVLLGLPLLLTHPALLRWAPVYAVLLAVSLRYAARRADRSWGNDLVTIAAAALMTVLAAGLAAPAPSGLLPPGADLPAAWGATAILTAYLVGTVPYVKSMIRERGERRTLRLSAGYHGALVLLAAVAWAAGWVAGAAGAVLVLVAAALAARAVLLPRRGRVRPAAIGAGEVVATVAVTLAALLAV
ncbi:MAG TPA: YwiC-like family protein [Cellulomonas sp.]